MCINHGLKRKEKDRLKDLITYFGSTVPHLQMVKVDKMIYIAQLYHYSTHGRLITNVPFLSLSRGPHSPDIRAVMEDLLERNIIYIEQDRSEIDTTNPCLLIKCDNPSTDHLPASCLNTLGQVLQDWGKKKFGPVLDYITRTIPFISTPYKERIDFRKIRPRPGLKEVLALPHRIGIHRVVQSPGEVTGNEIDWGPDPFHVSIHEVAEVYLCLCGTAPRGILFRERLGFDARAVLEVLDHLEAGNRDVPDQEGTDINRAARLTELLVSSNCFGHKNKGVALQTGLLFLKKRGFSLDEGLLKTISPKGYWYEEIKESFQRIGARVGSPGMGGREGTSR